MKYLEYLRIPYLHRGRTFEGADCFGLIRLFYKHELEIDLPDYTEEYEQEWWKQENLLLDQYKNYGFKLVKTFEPGNLIMFKNTSNTPGHVGIILGDNQFIHMTRNGVAINSYIRGMWARTIHSVYKQKKVKNASKTR